MRECGRHWAPMLGQSASFWPSPACCPNWSRTARLLRHGPVQPWVTTEPPPVLSLKTIAEQLESMSLPGCGTLLVRTELHMYPHVNSIAMLLQNVADLVPTLICPLLQEPTYILAVSEQLVYTCTLFRKAFFRKQCIRARLSSRALRTKGSWSRGWKCNRYNSWWLARSAVYHLNICQLFPLPDASLKSSGPTNWRQTLSQSEVN